MTASYHVWYYVGKLSSTKHNILSITADFPPCQCHSLICIKRSQELLTWYLSDTDALLLSQKIINQSAQLPLCISSQHQFTVNFLTAIHYITLGWCHFCCHVVCYYLQTFHQCHHSEKLMWIMFDLQFKCRLTVNTHLTCNSLGFFSVYGFISTCDSYIIQHSIKIVFTCS